MIDDSQPVTLCEQPVGPGGAPGEQLAGYPVVGRLGRGGMGEVLCVRDRRLGRLVAAKVLLGDAQGERALRKFEAEARVTGQLEHPNIVPLYDIGRDADGRAYFTMKRVEGQTLRARIKAGDGGPEDLLALLDVFLRVCDALAYAHSRGVLHRDLKPDNVMVGRFGQVLVMDWGLARVLSEPGSGELDAAVTLDLNPTTEAEPLRTLEGTIVGTPHYMPPEQARGEVSTLDERADIYALGAILHELLAGRPAFSGKTPWAVLAAVTEGRRQSPSEQAPRRTVPWELEAVVDRAMAADRDDRYDDVSGLAADVRRFLAGQAVGAATYTAGQRLTRWLSRHRWLLLAAAVVLIAAAGAAGAVRLRAQQQAARQAEQARAAVEQRVREAMDSASHEAAAVELPAEPGQAWATLAERLEAGDAPPQSARQRWRAALLAQLAAGARLDRVLGLAPASQRPELVEALRQQRLGLARQQAALAMLTRDLAVGEQALETLTQLGAADGGVAERLRAARAAWDGWQARRARALVDYVAAGGTLAGGKGQTLEECADEGASLRDPAAVAVFAEALAALGRQVDGGVSLEQRELARLLCRSLGRSATPRGIEALGTFLAGLPDGELAREAGLALCRTRSAAALPHVEAARKRLRFESTYWQAIRLAVARLPGRVAAVADDVDGQLEQANAALARDDHPTALRLYAQVLAVRPRDPVARVNRAIILKNQGKLEAALADLDVAIEVVRAVRRPGVLNNRANLLLALQRLDEAARDAEQAVELAPTLGMAWRTLAMIRQASQGAAAGLATLLEAERRGAPVDASALALRGRLRLSLSQHEQALADGRRAVALNRRHIGSQLVVADALQRLGRLAEAERAFERAIELDPQYAEGHRQLGLLAINRRALDLARGHLERALRADPAHADARAELVYVLIEQGDRAGAKRQLDAGLKAAPDHAKLRYRQGVLREAEGDPKGALESYRIAAKGDPSHWPSHFNAGNLLYQQQRFAEAVPLLARVTQLTPRHVLAWLLLGVSRANAGDRAGGLRDVRRARSLAPASEHARIDQVIRQLGG